MTDFILRYWIQTAFGVILATLAAGWRHLIKKTREYDATSRGVRALLRDRIIQMYSYYMDKGYLPIYALESLTDMYEEYQQLGGNGAVTQLVEELKGLPRKEK